MARMFHPPHPGLTLRDDVLPALGLQVTQAAEQLGVSRVALSRVLNGRAAISPEMALRIEAWLGVARGARPGYGWQNKAPMTCGKPHSDSRSRPCTFNPHRWPHEITRSPGAFYPGQKDGASRCVNTCQPLTTIESKFNHG